MNGEKRRAIEKNVPKRNEENVENFRREFSLLLLLCLCLLILIFWYLPSWIFFVSFCVRHVCVIFYGTPVCVFNVCFDTSLLYFSLALQFCFPVYFSRMLWHWSDRSLCEMNKQKARKTEMNKNSHGFQILKNFIPS